ncbi:MAG TPA: hypothetical protein VK154_07390 [Chitinophagales bacterium]|nr:hypothetical protein [Chitinophagales bacterium]
MKPLFNLTLLLLLACTSVFAGQGINYQAVARNASGQPIVNGTVSLKFTVHQDSPSGMVIYEETHTTPTNAFGIITVVVGGGMINTGNMDSIDWSTDKYLQVEYDATGGTSYSDMGTTKMMGSLFASYASSANTSNIATRSYIADSATLSASSLTSLHSLQADNATNAINATSAGNALTADHSLVSDRAITSDSATIAVTSLLAAHATFAENATNAEIAGNALTANHSLTADRSTKSDSATVAVTSLTSARATLADNATNAVSANNALTSNHALLSDNATHAVTATTATTALRADTATTATKALSSSGVKVYYAESRALSSSPSSGFQDKLTLTLQPGTYLITFSAVIGAENTNSIKYAFNYGTGSITGTPYVIAGSDGTLSVSNTVRQTFTTATTVKIQYSNNQNSSDRAHIKDASISALATE